MFNAHKDYRHLRTLLLCYALLLIAIVLTLWIGVHV